MEKLQIYICLLVPTRTGAHVSGLELVAEFATISNLHLNVDKTVCIPLWPSSAEEAKSFIYSHISQWDQLIVAQKGTYLGFVLGPGKATSSWDKPVAKYLERVKRWSQLGGGMQYGALTYNVFALSTLLFVGQLESIPQAVLDHECLNVCRMFPGPGNWITYYDA